jgi:hypothetical protein
MGLAVAAEADWWVVLQATMYILKMGTITPRQFLTGLAVVLFWLLIVVFGGGLTLLATQLGLVLTLAATPILLLAQEPPRIFAVKLLAVWACYLSFYVLISTGMAVYAYLPEPVARRTLAGKTAQLRGCSD